MKFQIDALSNIAVEYLRSRGHEVEKNLDWGDGMQSDKEILLRAFANRRIIITQDKDFGTLAFQHNLPHMGIIWVDPACDSRAVGQKIIQALEEHHQTVGKGEVLVLSNNKIRISFSTNSQRFKRSAYEHGIDLFRNIRPPQM